MNSLRRLVKTHLEVAVQDRGVETVKIKDLSEKGCFSEEGEVRFQCSLKRINEAFSSSNMKETIKGGYIFFIKIWKVEAEEIREPPPPRQSRDQSPPEGDVGSF